jgi:hypothetical protein
MFGKINAASILIPSLLDLVREAVKERLIERSQHGWN